MCATQVIREPQGGQARKACTINQLWVDGVSGEKCSPCSRLKFNLDLNLD